MASTFQSFLFPAILPSFHRPTPPPPPPSLLPLPKPKSLRPSLLTAHSFSFADQDHIPQPQNPRPRSSAPHEAGRLYVGNLPYSMTSAQLAEIFAESGTVESVEVVYDRVTERSRGFAFVTMSGVEDANEAIRMFDGSQIGGRIVKVNFPEVPRGGEREVMGPRIRSASRGFVDSPYKVYAGNLGWSVTSQGLCDSFASQQGFLGAKIVYDRVTGRSRGFGFVSFASSEDCHAAIDALNGLEIEGRPMKLSIAEARPNAGSSQDSSSSSLESIQSY